jgi:hypothetical protein
LTLRDGLGVGFDRSVTVGGDDLGRDWSGRSTVRRCVVVAGGGTVTVRPGVVTVSDEVVLVVVVV